MSLCPEPEEGDNQAGVDHDDEPRVLVHCVVNAHDAGVESDSLVKEHGDAEDEEQHCVRAIAASYAKGFEGRDKV